MVWGLEQGREHWHLSPALLVEHKESPMADGAQRLETLEGAQGGGWEGMDHRASKGNSALVLSRSLSHLPVPTQGLYAACATQRKVCISWYTNQSAELGMFGKSLALSSLSCLLLVFHYSASGCAWKTTRTSLLVGFHHFCLKRKLTKMKNSWIKKKSSKQISKQIQTCKN